MATTAEPAATAATPSAPRNLARAEGVELLGGVHGSGYKEGAALVRRGDGQMVQLGPLMYRLLEAADGERDASQIADTVSSKVGRRLGPEHVAKIAQKLAAQGLLAGTEDKAPPRRNPLLALRWKVLVTNPEWTRRLTAPFAFLFRPWLMWPIVAAFAGVFWFVLFHKGVASATTQAFHSPGLLLLVFVLAVLSAGFHELGHAAACRYGGATPGGMGAGLYLVWPAFYTDVTDAYRLPKRARLRVDLGGLYFNALVAVVTMAIWLAIRSDALLLLVALQVLQMVKQLSPVIRADGYHILSDATGIPDLYSHMGPTLRRLLPGHRHEPSALKGWARVFVTVWVLVVVPVLLSLMFGAIVLLPRLATSAWDSGRLIITALPHQVDNGQVLDVLASLVRLLALCLPVLGSALVTQKIVRGLVGKARSWSAARPLRRTALVFAASAVACAAAWAWWPSGQYQPIRANHGGTIAGLAQLVSGPGAVARPAAAVVPLQLTPGTHLAVSMIPVGGATRSHPALFIISGGRGKPAVEILSPTASAPPSGTASPTAAGTTTSGAASGSTSTVASTTTSAATSTGATSTGAAAPTSPTASGAGTAAAPSRAISTTASAAAFPFTLPSKPGPGGTQAVAVGTKNGGVTYDVAYSLVTVKNGAPVTNTNSAYALADCKACTTVAVSFQIVLVIGQSKDIAPINAAGALNVNCPACTTTALADQLVITLKSQPSAQLLAKLQADLRQLNALPFLGADGTPAAVAAVVSHVQSEIENQLNASGLPATPISNGSQSATSPSSSTPTAGSSTTASETSTVAPAATAPSSATTTSPATTVPGSASGGSAGSAATTTSAATPASGGSGSSAAGTSTSASSP